MKLSNKKAAFGSRKCTSIRASLSPSESGRSAAPIAPLQLESPIGQFLSQILTSHPHLVPAAVDQQLEQLQTERDSEQQKEEPSATGTDIVLYRLAQASLKLISPALPPSKKKGFLQKVIVFCYGIYHCCEV